MSWEPGFLRKRLLTTLRMALRPNRSPQRSIRAFPSSPHGGSSRLPRGLLSRILLDRKAPIGRRQILAGDDVVTAFDMGWETVTNGKLLDAAEREGFNRLVTSDQNPRYEQNLAGRRIALIVLGTTHWLTIKADPEKVVAACRGSQPGGCLVVSFAKPPRRRRSPPAAASPRPAWHRLQAARVRVFLSRI